jgi:glutamyl/glutaminyl-tRNA synthetase
LIRGAISAQTVTPPIFDCMAIIGKEKVLKRLADAAAFLKANA